MTIRARAKREKVEIDEVKHMMISKLCRLYETHKENEEVLDDESKQRARNGFLQQVEKELGKCFNLIRVYMATYRGESFKEDAVINRRFTQKVVEYIASDPTPKQCKMELPKIFQQLPHPKFKLEQSVVDEMESSRESITPLSSLKRPPSIRRVHESFRKSRSPSPSTGAIAREVQRLKSFKEKEKYSLLTVRDKLDKFTANFCESE